MAHSRQSKWCRSPHSCPQTYAYRVTSDYDRQAAESFPVTLGSGFRVLRDTNSRYGQTVDDCRELHSARESFCDIPFPLGGWPRHSSATSSRWQATSRAPSLVEVGRNRLELERLRDEELRLLEWHRKLEKAQKQLPQSQWWSLATPAFTPAAKLNRMMLVYNSRIRRYNSSREDPF